MGKNANMQKASKRRIADEILAQIGKSVLLVFVFVAILVIVMVWIVVTSARKSELKLESESAANQLTGFFEKYVREVEVLAADPGIQQVLDETKAEDDILAHPDMESIRGYLKDAVEGDPDNILSVWIADLDSSVLTQSDGFTTEDGWDITSRAWYACVESKCTILTEPYIDSSTGDMILSAVTPVYDDAGGVLGAAGVDITMAHVMEVMGEYKIGNNGYVLLVTQSGMVIYHPNEEMINKNLSEAGVTQNVIQAVEGGKSQFMKYKVNGKSKYGMVQAAGDTGYAVISNMSVLEYYSTLIGIIAALAIVFIVGALVVIGSIKKSAAALAKPIMDLNETAQKLAAGDLDVVLNVRSQNEIGELGNSIGETVKRLKEYIVYLNEASSAMDQIADGKLGIELEQDYVGEFQKIKVALLHISESMNSVLQGISDSAGTVSASANELAKAAQGLAEGAGAQASAVEELVATSATVTEQVEASKVDAERSADETVNVTVMMEQSQEKMTQMMDAVRKIHETSEQVVGIIQTIEEIAEQTNLLSLNASIEAARAGEAGKGFAVVADEIGKLAQESSKAANMTRNLIGVSMEEINKGKEIASDVMGSLENSVGAVNKVNGMIRKTAENAVVQAQSMEQIKIGIEEIAQGVQDNSAIAEESSATSQELASQAMLLNEMVHKFELI